MRVEQVGRAGRVSRAGVSRPRLWGGGGAPHAEGCHVHLHIRLGDLGRILAHLVRGRARARVRVGVRPRARPRAWARARAR